MNVCDGLPYSPEGEGEYYHPRGTLRDVFLNQFLCSFKKIPLN